MVVPTAKRTKTHGNFTKRHPAETYSQRRSRADGMRGAYERGMMSTDRAAAGLHPAARRIFEVLPPALAWVVVTAPAWAAVVAPRMLGYFLVAFSAYWLWRSLEFTAGLLIGLRRLHLAQQRDWLAAGRSLAGFDRLHHLVLVPTYTESDEILSTTLECL